MDYILLDTSFGKLGVGRYALVFYMSKFYKYKTETRVHRTRHKNFKREIA